MHNGILKAYAIDGTAIPSIFGARLAKDKTGAVSFRKWNFPFLDSFTYSEKADSDGLHRLVGTIAPTEEGQALKSRVKLSEYMYKHNWHHVPPCLSVEEPEKLLEADEQATYHCDPYSEKFLVTTLLGPRDSKSHCLKADEARAKEIEYVRSKPVCI